MKKFVSRKFFLTVFLLLGIALLLVFGKIDAGNYERLTIWIAGLYFGANVSDAAIQKAEKAKVEAVKTP